jgi:hypothetical protein
MTSRQLASKATVVAVLTLVSSVAGSPDSLTVTVCDEESGAALAKAVVAAVVGESVVASGRTDANGTWTGTAPNAKVTVLAAKDSHAIGKKAINAAETASLRFALAQYGQEDFQRLGRIVGFVRSDGGQPIGNATLVLFKANAPIGATMPENATGVYELEWYPPGAYTVLATAPGHESTTYTGQAIAAGESLWLDVTLKKK